MYHLREPLSTTVEPSVASSAKDQNRHHEVGENAPRGHPTSPLTIAGFGACMINGDPFRPEDSFFHKATWALKQELPQAVETSVISLPGLPITRAIKYYKKKIKPMRPDIVVVQFGSTDSVIPIRKRLGKLARVMPPPPPVANIGKPSRWKWWLKSLAAELLLLNPITDEETYIESIRCLITQAQATATAVVLVSPFVMASSRSNRCARKYTQGLKVLTAQTPGVYCLDAHALLSAHPKHTVLCPDGLHITPLAHQLIAVELTRLLTTISRLKPNAS